MSYTRSAWKRKYTFGESSLYSFIGTDGNLWVAGSTCKEGFEIIEKGDVFEFIVSVLECAGVKLSKEQLRRLAEELEVKLRSRPLSWKKMLDAMEKKGKKMRKRREEKHGKE